MSTETTAIAAPEATSITVPMKRPPGRPKGYPKTGGRRKGVPNSTTAATRDFIMQQANPIEFLCRIARGLQFEAALQPGDTTKRKVYPTLEQRVHAAQTLARKVMPDMKAVEVTGADGGPVALTLLDFLKGLPA